MNVPAWVQMVSIAAACAGLTPIVTALVVQWQWPSWAKTVVGLILAGAGALAGVAALAPEPPQTVSEWIVFGTAVVAATQAAYRMLWKPAGVQRVEVATTVGPSGPADEL